MRTHTAGTVVAGTGEAGGAECLIPAVRELEHRGRAVYVLAGDRARPLFQRAGIAFEHVLDGDAREAATQALARHTPAVVLTGLVGDKNNLDYALIGASHRMHVPVASILDSWMNYGDRVRDPLTGCILSDLMPDRIAVMDEAALAEMVAEGIPPAICEVTGHPKFDALPPHTGPTPAFRARFGIAPAEYVITFFSHGTAQFYPKAQLGYDEADAIDVLFRGIRQLSRELPLFLIFKEHPRAPAQGLAVLTPPDRYLWLETTNADELMVCSDVVASIASTMLVFASRVGIPVISIQPNLKAGEDRCVLTRRGALTPVGSVDEFVTQLRQALSANVRASPRQWPAHDARASERIADLLDAISQPRVTR